jgi:RNA polymerase sigma factor (sigma-70 family)
MPHPDQKYIDALVNNDTVLLEELYQKFSGKIKWMVLHNRGTETDAADIFQDALVSIFNKAKTQNFVLTCPLDAFLYLICRNKWINELKKRKSAGVTFNDEEGYNNVGEESFKLAEEYRLLQERKDLLNEKTEMLGEGCKELLRLSWSGKSMEEVADILHVTYGYARKKKSECMAKLITLVKQSSRFNALKW